MRFKEWLLLQEKIMVGREEYRDILSALQRIYETHLNPENLVVTYTAVDKIGMNPKSVHDTPVGIYFYPLKYVIDVNLQVPWAGGQPFLNVCEFTRPNKILRMTNDDRNQKGLELINQIIPDKSERESILNMVKRHDIRSDYSYLWLAAMLEAKSRNLFKTPISWNANFRKVGIDGFVDENTSTIHENEPVQGVVFVTSALKRLYVIKLEKGETSQSKSEKSVDVGRVNAAKSEISDENILRMLRLRKNLSFQYLAQLADQKTNPQLLAVLEEKFYKTPLNKIQELPPLATALFGKVADSEKLVQFIKIGNADTQTVNYYFVNRQEGDPRNDPVLKAIIKFSSEHDSKALLRFAHDKQAVFRAIVEKSRPLPMRIEDLRNYLSVVDDHDNAVQKIIADFPEDVKNPKIAELLASVCNDPQSIAKKLGIVLSANYMENIVNLLSKGSKIWQIILKQIDSNITNEDEKQLWYGKTLSILYTTTSYPASPEEEQILYKILERLQKIDEYELEVLIKLPRNAEPIIKKILAKKDKIAGSFSEEKLYTKLFRLTKDTKSIVKIFEEQMKNPEFIKRFSDEFLSNIQSYSLQIKSFLLDKIDKIEGEQQIKSYLDLHHDLKMPDDLLVKIIQKFKGALTYFNAMAILNRHAQDVKRIANAIFENKSMMEMKADILSLLLDRARSDDDKKYIIDQYLEKVRVLLYDHAVVLLSYYPQQNRQELLERMKSKTNRFTDEEVKKLEKRVTRPDSAVTRVQ